VSKKLRLSLGCWNYDRTRALQDGRVQPDGIELTYLDMPVEETFFRMLRHQEFDVAELSLSSYTVSLFKEKRNFIAIPVFPSRFFRHSCIYVNAAAGIREPKDLIGKKVGNPEYQMTAPVWIRGILQDEYGVPVDTQTYYTGGEEEPNRPEKLKLDLPPRIKVQPIGEKDTLAAMLRDGGIDAFYTARMPSTYHTGGGKGEAPLRELHGSGAGVLPQDRHLPDHAHGGDQAQRLREASVGRHVALQGVRRVAAAHV
jgi:4,5-dihydroxyphthalate decarboxylase